MNADKSTDPLSCPFMNVPTVSAASLGELWKKEQKINLIDVRTPSEYQAMHVEFARNVPLDQLNAAAIAKTYGEAQDEPLYLICQSGNRGEKACKQLIALGYTSVANILGGTIACEAVGLPIIHGKKSVSLERQVRIAAGSLVLLGIFLSWFVHPALLGVAAFVGGGLIFAGITDSCGMGMLLAKMPWNRGGSPAGG